MAKIYESPDGGVTVYEREIGNNNSRKLVSKLKRIEETWVQNGFQISDKQVQQIVKS